MHNLILILPPQGKKERYKRIVAIYVKKSFSKDSFKSGISINVVIKITQVEKSCEIKANENLNGCM